MKLARLWQPQRPLFWLLVVFNLLSSLCAWLMRNPALGSGAVWVLGALALANMAFGLLVAWRLLTEE